MTGVQTCALPICAEAGHCETEFWRLAHRLGVAHAFDRFLVPTSHLGATHGHERKAGTALNWLSHLQAEERLIADSIAMGMLRSDRPYVAALFRRRRDLKRGLRQVVTDYRRLRAQADEDGRRLNCA